MNNNNNQNQPRVNFRIRVPQVRLIGSDGNQIGILDTREALRLAQEEGLDLVEINPRATPPVCKIIDFGKFKYEESKRIKEMKKNQKVSVLKEIGLKPKTDDNDLKHKLEQAKGFLQEGHKVKFTVRFKGREIVHPQVGENQLRKIMDELKEFVGSFSGLSLEGKYMSVIAAPK